MTASELNVFIMFVIAPIAGAFVGFVASHDAKAGVMTSALFAIAGLLLGVVLALASKPIVDSVLKRALRQTSFVASSLLVGASSLIVMLSLLVVVLGTVFIVRLVL